MCAYSNECLQDYMEKTIKISQKANSDKGFGFTLGGGADKKQPVVVEKVRLGKDLGMLRSWCWFVLELSLCVLIETFGFWKETADHAATPLLLKKKRLPVIVLFGIAVDMNMMLAAWVLASI